MTLEQDVTPCSVEEMPQNQFLGWEGWGGHKLEDGDGHHDVAQEKAGLLCSWKAASSSTAHWGFVLSPQF